MKTVFQFLQHINIILAFVFLAFRVLDWFNPFMGFTTNTVSSVLFVLFCLSALLSSLWALSGRPKPKKYGKRGGKYAAL